MTSELVHSYCSELRLADVISNSLPTYLWHGVNSEVRVKPLTEFGRDTKFGGVYFPHYGGICRCKCHRECVSLAFYRKNRQGCTDVPLTSSRITSTLKAQICPVRNWFPVQCKIYCIVATKASEESLIVKKWVHIFQWLDALTKCWGHMKYTILRAESASVPYLSLLERFLVELAHAI